MSATMVWTIEYMQCKPTEGSLTDVVVTAGWRCTGTQEDNGTTYTASVYSTCSFPQPGDPFTPYADLTQDQVLGWCWANGVDQASAEAAVAQNLANQINPPLIQPPLPWNA